MTIDEQVRLLRSLERFFRDDTVLALEFLALDPNKYPELEHLEDLLWRIHLVVTAVHMRVLGFRVEPIDHGYLFAPPNL